VFFIFRKFFVVTVVLSLLLVSAVPIASAMQCAENDDISISDTNSVMSDCCIECGCHVDNHLDGMPQQLAPHVLSLSASIDRLGSIGDIRFADPVFIPRFLFFPTPPPIIS